MRRSQLGLLLVVTGVFIPLVSVPFADGHLHGAGLLQNIQRMRVSIVPDKFEPSFRSVDPTNSITNPSFVDISPTFELSAPSTPITNQSEYDVFRRLDPEKVRFFPNGYPEDEVAKALRAGKKQIEKSKGTYLMFYGWTVTRPGVRLPFSFIVSGSLLLAFVGVVVILTQKKSK